MKPGLPLLSVLGVVGGDHGGVGDCAEEGPQVGHYQGDPEPVVSCLRDVRQGGCTRTAFMASRLGHQDSGN